jgi:hypothetical protein
VTVVCAFIRSVAVPCRQAPLLVCLHTKHCARVLVDPHRFYETDSAIKIGMMEAFAKLAVDPESLPDIIFASIGRTTWKVRAPCLCV